MGFEDPTSLETNLLSGLTPIKKVLWAHQEGRGSRLGDPSAAPHAGAMAPSPEAARGARSPLPSAARRGPLPVRLLSPF